MPKIIKKKAVKSTVKTTDEEELKSALSKAASAAGRSWRRYSFIMVSVVIIIAASAGFYFYKENVKSRAAKLEYEGYRTYYGLYEKQPMIKTERVKKALESFKSAYELRPSPFSLFYIANSHYALGNVKEAIASLKELIAKFPEDERLVPIAYYRLATAQVKAGDKEGALKSLEELGKYPSDSYKDIALMESAGILEGMGKADDARKKYEALVKDFPQSPFIGEAKSKTAVQNATGFGRF